MKYKAVVYWTFIVNDNLTTEGSPCLLIPWKDKGRIRAMKPLFSSVPEFQSLSANTTRCAIVNIQFRDGTKVIDLIEFKNSVASGGIENRKLFPTLDLLGEVDMFETCPIYLAEWLDPNAFKARIYHLLYSTASMN